MKIVESEKITTSVGSRVSPIGLGSSVDPRSNLPSIYLCFSISIVHSSSRWFVGQRFNCLHQKHNFAKGHVTAAQTFGFPSLVSASKLHHCRRPSWSQFPQTKHTQPKPIQNESSQRLTSLVCRGSGIPRSTSFAEVWSSRTPQANNRSKLSKSFDSVDLYASHLITV